MSSCASSCLLMSLVEVVNVLFDCVARHEAPHMNFAPHLSNTTNSSKRLLLVGDCGAKCVGIHGMHEKDMVSCCEIGS